MHRAHEAHERVCSRCRGSIDSTSRVVEHNLAVAASGERSYRYRGELLRLTNRSVLSPVESLNFHRYLVDGATQQRFYGRRIAR